MPRKGPRRPVLTFRITEAGISALATRAQQENIPRSELIRRMLAYAAWKMPKGWRP